MAASMVVARLGGRVREPLLPRPQTHLWRRWLVSALALGAACAGGERRVVPIVATDYAYRAADTLEAGPVAFTLDNRGQVAHEVVIGPLRPGATPVQVRALLATGAEADSLQDGVAVLLASPGHRAFGQLTAELLPGRTYALICYFRDSDTLPAHSQLGMVAFPHAR